MCHVLTEKEFNHVVTRFLVNAVIPYGNFNDNVVVVLNTCFVIPETNDENENEMISDTDSNQSQ